MKKQAEEIEPLPFKLAATFVLPFGKYAKQKLTLDQIAETDEGLKYLNWLRGARAEDGKRDIVDRALAGYLDDPAIRKDVEALEDRP